MPKFRMTQPVSINSKTKFNDILNRFRMMHRFPVIFGQLESIIYLCDKI